jgi:hypothetical protein
MQAFAQANQSGDFPKRSYDPSGELLRFRRWRAERVLELAAAGEPDRIHGTLVLAIGSRETNLRNIVGGGYFDDLGDWHTTGVDRGLFQINQVYHERWLASVQGCQSGEYAEVYGVPDGGALPIGRVPGLTASIKKVISILRYNITLAVKAGIPDEEVLAVAVAGYNGGVGSAIRAYQKDGDPDLVTTGKNYSRDVLLRQRAIRSFIQNRKWG